MADLYRSDITDVDLNKSLLRSYAGELLATGDNLSNRYGVRVYRQGEAVNLSGFAVTGYFIRPDMETVVITGEVSGNVAYVDLPQACYTQQGQFSLAIKVSGSGITQTVRIADGFIRTTQTDTLIDPGSVVPTLDELFAQITAMEAATAAAEEVVAEYEGKVAEQDASITALTEDMTANKALRKTLNDVADADANNIVENGYYFFGGTDMVLNVPENANGVGGVILSVYDYKDSAAYRHYQICIDYQQNIYMRNRNGENWKEWKELCFTTDIPDVPENVMALKNSLTSENLDDVIESGYYFAGGDADLVNYPATENGKAFMLLVINGGEATRRYQLYFSYGTEKIYFRRSGYDMWTEWRMIAFTSDIPTVSDNSALSIQKDSTGSFVISFGKYTCKFRRYTNTNTNADLYDLYDIYCGDTMITNGNIMGVLKEDGQADFIGGIDHGDEGNYTLSIKCDNADYDTESGALVACNSIEINYTSELYRVSDKTHIYNKTVRLNIARDKIVIYNDCECLVDDSTLVHAYNGGMVDCQFPELIGTVMDNLYSFPAPTAEPNNNSHDNVKSALYWTGGAVRLNNITGHQKDTYKGRVVAYKNPDGSPQRNKIYYDIVGATATPIANGEHIVGEYEMIFE